MTGDADDLLCNEIIADHNGHQLDSSQSAHTSNLGSHERSLQVLVPTVSPTDLHSLLEYELYDTDLCGPTGVCSNNPSAHCRCEDDASSPKQIINSNLIIDIHGRQASSEFMTTLNTDYPLLPCNTQKLPLFSSYVVMTLSMIIFLVYYLHVFRGYADAKQLLAFLCATLSFLALALLKGLDYVLGHSSTLPLEMYRYIGEDILVTIIFAFGFFMYDVFIVLSRFEFYTRFLPKTISSVGSNNSSLASDNKTIPDATQNSMIEARGFRRLADNLVTWIYTKSFLSLVCCLLIIFSVEWVPSDMGYIQVIMFRISFGLRCLSSIMEVCLFYFILLEKYTKCILADIEKIKITKRARVITPELHVERLHRAVMVKTGLLRTVQLSRACGILSELVFIAPALSAAVYPEVLFFWRYLFPWIIIGMYCISFIEIGFEISSRQRLLRSTFAYEEKWKYNPENARIAISNRITSNGKEAGVLNRMRSRSRPERISRGMSYSSSYSGGTTGQWTLTRNGTAATGPRNINMTLSQQRSLQRLSTMEEIPPDEEMSGLPHSTMAAIHNSPRSGIPNPVTSQNSLGRPKSGSWKPVLRFE